MTRKRLPRFILAMMALIAGLFGYMIWDRRTAQKPLANRVTNIEYEHLDIKNPSGSNIKRLIAALRKLAENNKEVAEVLRAHALL